MSKKTTVVDDINDAMTKNYGDRSLLSYSDYLADNVDKAIEYAKYIEEEKAKYPDAFRYLMNSYVSNPTVSYDEHFDKGYGMYVSNPYADMTLINFDLVADPGLTQGLIPDPSNPFDCDDDDDVD